MTDDLKDQIYEINSKTKEIELAQTPNKMGFPVTFTIHG